MTVPSNPEPPPLEMLEDVNLALSELLGCLIPPSRSHHLSRAVSRAAARLGLEDTATFCRRIIERRVDGAVLEELATELLPGETYFFRDQPCMEALEQHLIPRLIRERGAHRRLNVWSAACSTGEEPLTLAMMLHSRLAELADWKVKILATDLRSRALDVARRGSYREWSFRGCPEWLKERYFERQAPGSWRILPEIQSLVEYRQCNLVREPFPSPGYPAGFFDLIVCRNVLIYLDPQRIPPLLEQLRDCLAEGGWLLLAAVETPAVDLERFECVRLGGTLFFRKQNVSGPPPAIEAAIRRESGRRPGVPCFSPFPGGFPAAGSRMAREAREARNDERRIRGSTRAEPGSGALPDADGHRAGRRKPDRGAGLAATGALSGPAPCDGAYSARPASPGRGRSRQGAAVLPDRAQTAGTAATQAGTG